MLDRAPSPLLVALATLLTTAAAHAGRGKPCSDCESCTAALAEPGVEIALDAPISTTGACVVIRGAGSTFDGGRHAIKGADPAVSVEADDVFVRHVRVEGGERGLSVAGARATLLDVETRDATIGLDVDGAEGARVVRSRFHGGRIGVAFGAPPVDVCPPNGTLRSPGAVLTRVEITGARVGVAACEAVPVIAHSTLRDNAVGLAQARLAGKPTDPCACDPALSAMRPATTLFYSSGCGGCEIHEGFLPDVRAQGHDVRLRQTGKEHAADTAQFDAYTRRCAPEITDAIGIPGCVPNYACIASGEVAKRRGDDDRLVVDHRLSSADDVAEFAARCVAAGAADFAGAPACVTHQVRDSVICGNKTNIGGAPVTGQRNRCTGPDALGCAPCDAAAAAPATPTAPEPFPAAPEPA